MADQTQSPAKHTPKNALITGSTSGIWLAIAEHFASQGLDIMINGLGQADHIEITRQKLANTYGVTVLYSDADMTDAAAISSMMQQAEEAFGGLDILVNNAGIQHVCPVEDFPADMWDKIISINLTSAFHTIKAAIPAMKARGYGRIINVASAHALVASPYKSAYVAAKHGIAGLTKTVALEVARTGITVNAICPGYVRTPLVEKQIPDTAKARGLSEEEVVRDILLAAQPTGRFVETEEVAAYAWFLASPAAGSITGSIQNIDGGWTAA